MVLAFWGSALVARRGSHIAVEFVLNVLPADARRLARLAVALLATAFFAISVLLCVQVAKAMQFQPMIAIEWPISVIYWGILAGLVLTTLRSLQHAIRRLRVGEPERPGDPSLGGVQL